MLPIGTWQKPPQPQQKKTKKSNTINGLRKGIFNRLQYIITFEEDPVELTMESPILELYAPRVLTSCSTPSIMPEDPLDVQAFKCSMMIPGLTPFFQQPKTPQRLPAASKRKIFVQPIYPSLIPILLTAKRSGINIKRYHVISERNSLRKLAMNDDDFVINVVRFGSTLFLRRFGKYRAKDKNDVGFRFEEMCTGECKVYSDYNQLIDAHVGEFKVLMMGEVDTIRRDNGESIELKCKKSGVPLLGKSDWWLQSYLTGTNTIVVGRRAEDDDTVISTFEEYATETLVDRQKKMKMFNRLHCALRFLFLNVANGRSYMLRGFKIVSTDQRSVSLFEVIDESDKKQLTFITNELIDMFSVAK